MTIDFLHLYCECPHCTTKFRAAVSDIDNSGGWVKCGHCRKVFDCRKNEIKPADFIKAEETTESDAEVESESNEQSAINPDAKQIDNLEPAPQISLFEEAQSSNNPDQSQIKLPDVKPSVPDDEELIQLKQPRANIERAEVDKFAPSLEKKPGENVSLEAKSDLRQADDGLVHSSKSSQASEQRVSPKINLKNSPVTEKEKSQRPQSQLQNRLNIDKPQAPAFSAILLAKAKSWKKQKNRFKRTKAVPYVLIAVALFSFLIWQIAIVNYTKLSSYKFLSTPLAAICSLVTCNQTQSLQSSGFEILHASVRRHANIPNVMSVSAKLINFSSEDKLMPTLRLDLTDESNTIIASRTIELPENPQYIDPALIELAPGQDVDLLFNIDNPDTAAHGFQLNLVNN